MFKDYNFQDDLSKLIVCVSTKHKELHVPHNDFVWHIKHFFKFYIQIILRKRFVANFSS